ncbi:hypothetical protein [Rathayibacter sp. VKM Ac-2803]|uniref:hypothetical protein n=1 Tax=Rathayibacter sp. VKM Ac-2803 TaxID=2609256 RepID=UPI00135CBFE5|nr:hypothetical protein [Rathayibacter sp. VKM Ac-2803]
MALTDWSAWKASGYRRVTHVGILGDGRAHATLLSVSKSGLRVRIAANGTIERWHPSDVRPGWL